ncbi:multidrug ABC transporter permease [Devosia geojensis]|uniref:Transport permease protein n=1 Tax=Devosia geojensis TaxID=443610 RepID=A0A0F5FNR9_9HYPH|nr:ABC transporter permease [Devosia geojensis]KKB10483.1 multidrug ABC transporter permease [Devosia geojensis]
MTFFSDTWVVFTRAMKLSLREPLWVVIGITQPILYLTLFGPLLEQVASAPGFPPGDAWVVFVPGLLVQLGIFGGLFVGFGIITEWRAGVIDRMMVTPASRTALITGRVLRDVVVLIVQAVILIACAYLFGLRVPFWAVAVGLVLIGLLGAAFSYLSYAFGLITKNEDAFAPLVNSLALPVLLLSGILLPMSLAPQWLQVLSNINPFKHVVDALRAIFRGEIGTPEALFGLALAVVLVALGAWFGNRVFEGQTR